MARMAAEPLSLSPPERLFRQCLLDCRENMQGVPGMENLELRWTGGWVRDKLLGATSHDIDVALSTMTGEQFGKALQEYMKSNGTKYEEEAKREGFTSDIKDLHKIKANPEKSKNLETITTRMFGLDVDLVNLRKEVYNESSRNPQMEFGTPQEDAVRRDACVNALFYNLDTQKVEDFTGRGLQDMEAKLIRTPLAPYQTFVDDPLRVLRLIRFAARLDYTIQDDALQAMADPRIHEALRMKISRERVGVEVGKIMTGPNAFSGLTRIYDLDLYVTVFGDPSSNLNQVDNSSFPVALDALRQVLDHASALSLVLKPKDDITTAWTLAAYVPYADDEAAALNAAREGIKATNVISKTLSDAITNRDRIRNSVHKVNNQEAGRADVGMLLRGCGKSWRFHVLYSLLCDATKDSFEEVNKSYSTFVQYVQAQDLEGAAEIKPILNGNEIKKTMDISKAGSWIKTATEMVVRWQFAHPEGTTEEAVEWIRQHKDELQAG
ncbi:CCA tRNA nucleotidyltransferase, mitochondrial [Lithohypha guttulata]|uniref:CCA tRNA nucleotidyltransferase, mitochondrial n=1 Tax=Lithohypha guttulata TaxID=1690604 RepID=A0AAN7T0X4_9EURO|nr:CCA tRNA nucleotidyltransferase, mitochondrial [Lithohypha guttulata]KAK5085938.1 CCA tRNA nucleotidyltransferase, mitochondrial [Lithohypha guttulata]KAK5098340.1 CCA tRNA nucleotidyltransferase, mitochondrial [Lithohypha guttulata]